MNEKIAVIGGGQMGSQIAALAAMAGYTTNIYDENKENLEYRYNFVEDMAKIHTFITHLLHLIETFLFCSTFDLA